MDAATSMPSVQWRIRDADWDSGHDKRWNGSDVPDLVVYYLLAELESHARGSIRRMVRGTAISIDICYTLGKEELPF